MCTRYVYILLTYVIGQKVEERRIAGRGCPPQEDEQRREPDRFLLDGRPEGGCLFRYNLLRTSTHTRAKEMPMSVWSERGRVPKGVLCLDGVTIFVRVSEC